MHRALCYKIELLKNRCGRQGRIGDESRKMKSLKFTKMHGLGNDFMVVDGINQSFNPQEAPLTRRTDRGAAASA